MEWPPDWSLPLEENVLDRSLRAAFSSLGTGLPGIRLSIGNPIPLTRGLGSSGAAIIAGIKIAEQITGERFSDGDALRIAFPLEGHPDNLAASLLGGWVLSWTSGVPGAFPAIAFRAVLPIRRGRAGSGHFHTGSPRHPAGLL